MPKIVVKIENDHWRDDTSEQWGEFCKPWEGDVVLSASACPYDLRSYYVRVVPVGLSRAYKWYLYHSAIPGERLEVRKAGEYALREWRTNPRVITPLHFSYYAHGTFSRGTRTNGYPVGAEEYRQLCRANAMFDNMAASGEEPFQFNLTREARLYSVLLGPISIPLKWADALMLSTHDSSEWVVRKEYDCHELYEKPAVGYKLPEGFSDEQRATLDQWKPVEIPDHVVEEHGLHEDEIYMHGLPDGDEEAIAEPIRHAIAFLRDLVEGDACYVGFDVTVVEDDGTELGNDYLGGIEWPQLSLFRMLYPNDVRSAYHREILTERITEAIHNTGRDDAEVYPNHQWPSEMDVEIWLEYSDTPDTMTWNTEKGELEQ